MRNYTCAEYVNTAILRRILRARKVDRDQLAQLKSLEKRLKAQGGDHHRLDFALPDPQVCVDDLFGRLYPKRDSEPVFGTFGFLRKKVPISEEIFIQELV